MARGGNNPNTGGEYWADQQDGDYVTEHVERVAGDSPARQQPLYVPSVPKHAAPAHTTSSGGASASAVVAALLAVVLALAIGVGAYMWLSDSRDSGSATNDQATASSNAQVASNAGDATEATPESVETEPAQTQPSVIVPAPQPAAPTTLTFAEGEGAKPMETYVPTASPSRPSSSTSAQADQFRAPETATQCAANVNWRIFSPEEEACAFAEEVAIAMAPYTRSDQSQKVEVETPGGGQPANVTCETEGDNSYTCTGGGALVYLEDRSVRD